MLGMVRVANASNYFCCSFCCSAIIAFAVAQSDRIYDVLTPTDTTITITSILFSSVVSCVLPLQLVSISA